MQIQGKPTRVLIRGRKISSETGRFSGSPFELYVWRVGPGISLPRWADIDRKLTDERRRDDRKDVQLVVEFQGTKYESVITADELSQALADEPEPEPEPKSVFQPVPVVIEHDGRTVGPFTDRTEAESYGHRVWGRHGWRYRVLPIDKPATL